MNRVSSPHLALEGGDPNQDLEDGGPQAALGGVETEEYKGAALSIHSDTLPPPPGPEGAGLRHTGPFPGRLPARPDPGLRGSPQLPTPDPGHRATPELVRGRLNVKIILTTDVKDNQRSLAPLSPPQVPAGCRSTGGRERARGPAENSQL